MKNKLSILITAFVFLCGFLPAKKSYASHAAGGEVIYEWISDSTYRIYFKFYRDCTGVQEPDPNAEICVSNSCSITGPNTGRFPAAKWNGPIPDGTQNGDPVSPGCSQYGTTCSTPRGTLPGYRQWWYYIYWTSDGKCNSWTFSAYVSARNPSNNLVGGDLYVETTLDNYHFEGNSSPFFSVKPISYLCYNRPFIYNNGAVDPDGDSLYIEMIRPLTGSCGSASSIGWNTGTAVPPAGSPPFSIPNNPLSTNNTFTLDHSTGQMTFTANQQGPSTLTCKVSEYYTNPSKHGFDIDKVTLKPVDRVQNNPVRGAKIGHIMRDIQVQVLDCSLTAPDFVLPTSSILGGAWLNNRVNGCTNQRLQFDFWFKADSPDVILTVEDNHAVTLPGATLTYSHLYSDSIHGHFDWTPGSSDAGLKGFIVTIKDTTCKPPGIMLYYPTSIPVYIWPPVVASPDTSVCPGETAFLNAEGGQNYQWTVKSGGPISQLNCTNCKSPVATSIQKTTYLVTSTANTFCPNNFDSVTVDILPGLVFKPLQDVTTCPNNSVTLDLKPNPPAGVKYTIKWNPGKYLNDSTKPAVVVTPKDSLTYYITLTSSANQCKGYDTVNVGVLTGFHLDNIDTAICDGAHVDVRASADPRYTILWSDDSSYQGIFTALNVVNPTITPFKTTVKEKFTMTLSYLDASNNKLCRDTSASFRIDYQPNPIVTVDKDAAMCAGDTMQMNGTANPPYPYDYTWTPGSSLNNPKILSPIFTATQSAKLTLTAMTKEAKCTGSASVNLTVFPAAFLFASNDTAICPGEAAQLHVTGNGVKSFRWVPDVRIDDPYSYNPVVAPPATQEYRVYAVDTNYCSDTAKVLVTVHPKAVLELPDSVRLYPGQSYSVQPAGNCSYFTWYPPLGLNRANISNPIVKPDVNTRYFVTGTTEAGCSAYDSLNVFVSNESVIDIANAFVPGSGENGKARVIHLGDATLKKFVIYNRWGAPVFETADINEGWDGTFKGEPQPIGVYVYTVEAVTPSGRVFTKQGNITLIR